MPLSQPILNKAPMRHFSKVIEPAKSLFAEIVDINMKVNSCEFDRKKVKDMNTAQISNLIKNVFKPDKQFPFTKTNSRSFR